MRNIFDRIFRRGRIDTQLQEEIDTHIAMRAERNREEGMGDDEALRRARIRFGNRNAVREDVYRLNGFALFDALWGDFRTSLRTCRRYSGVTALALLSLTLGIGVNTLAFSFLNALLFRALPYPNADQLVVTEVVTPAECMSLVERSAGVFAGIGCYEESATSASLAEDGSGTLLPQHVIGQRLSPASAQALGIQPQIGRWFSEEKNVAVISHRLWQGRFGGNREILGQSVRMDGVPVTIAGVMPPEFEFVNYEADYWIPLRDESLDGYRESRMLGVVGRLTGGVTLSQAQSLLAAVTSDRKPDDRVTFTRMSDSRPGVDQLLILQGAVLFVLLIACANVAALLLTQAASERDQLAVRTALGSGAWRIARQVIVHSVLLFSAGGLCGFAAGWAGVRMMVNVVLPYFVGTYGPPRGGIPRAVLDAGIDSTVFLFTFSIAIVFGFVAALAPVSQALRSRPLDILREASQNASAGFSRQRMRSVFVSVQIALAFVLLVGAGLMLNGMRLALGQDIGFNTADLLAVNVRIGNVEAQGRFVSEQMRQNLAGIAGVVSSSAIAISPPLSGVVTIPVRTDSAPSEENTAQFLPIFPTYFETLQVKVVQGREFGSQDRLESDPVAVINEAAARQYWPNQNPLGRQIRIASPRLPNEQPRRVIGVVTEVSQYVGQQSRPQMYLPYAQLGTVEDEQLESRLRNITFILRTSRPAFGLSAAIGTAIGQADRMLAVSSIHTMQETTFASTQRRGIFVALMTLFGAIAVILALVGVYGVTSSIVNQRFNELGIRIAMGAEPWQIRQFVIRQGGFLIGIGLFAGVLMAFGLTRLIRNLVFGSSTLDPFTFGLGLVLLGAAGFVACYIPARRAARIDPITALRHS